MRVDIVRRGGIAGISLTGRLDTATLARADGEAVERELAGLPFGASRATPARPDAFEYEITVAGDRDARRATCAESDLSDALRSRLDAALRLPHAG